MLPLPRGAVWQALFFLTAVLLTNEVHSEGRVVCYYTNWSVYRPGTAKFNPQNINPYLCTHLVYAFGGFTKDNQMKPFDKYQDIEQGGYAKFTGLKTYNKQLKTMIAIGGWNEASSRFSPLVANPERRQKFIKNILKFLRQNHFDGIDLDWEYPAHREGGKPRDRDNYAQFVQELRAEFEREAEKTGRPRLLVTMAVPAGIEYIDKGYDIPKLNKYLDWFNVLTYDFHSSHEPSVNHHAPLYSLEEESEYNYDSELNIDYSIKYYLKAGADRDKLVLGIPTYGRSYTLINEESTELGAPSEGPGEQGDATREKGYLAYYEICQNIKEDPEWTVVQPNPTAMGPYAFRRNQWVGYDDVDIVRKKAEYVVEQGLGGIMFWAIDNDDFRGSCTGKPYPLIEAAKEAMVEGLGLGVNEVSKPSSAKKPLRSRSRDNTSSTRNRIDDATADKFSVDQRKETRRPTSGPRKRVQSSTTNAPSTSIKLTEAEGSSLYIGGRTSTPPPPTTPDPGTDFKCEEEGFFQHPRDCKKYYWCLDSGPSGLGIVAHMFTCPSGLYFNPAADSCDFARNVPCKIKKATTPSPVTTTTSTSTTTPRTTTASNRITAATSRTSLFRTTTTTTTAAPAEEEEYEYEEEDIPTKDSKDKNAEEDPRVIKELIELIRKVGGIDELEKHLLHKEDGTISLKDNDTNSGTPTTQSSISKSLYDKVLSRPSAYNSFRNRLTTSTLFRNSAQIKTEEVEKKEGSTKFEEDILQQKSSSKVGSSKYSSVVRGNSRQGPQNEGLENLPEFDGFLKEKKEYVTINRQRSSLKAQYSKDEDSQDDDGERVDEEVELEDIRTTKKPSAVTTPAYVSIRRTRPTTIQPATNQNVNTQEDKDELKAVEEVTEKKSYTSLNRFRGRPTTTTEKIESNDEVDSTTTRYKHFERTRPTRITTSRTTGEETDDDDKDDDNDEEENKQNVTVQNKEENDSTQNTQTTTRIYASIGRRPITTTTSEPSITTTTEIPIAKANLLETTYTPEPISTTITTHTPNTITNIPDIISTSFTPISSTTIPTTTTSTTPKGDALLETTSINPTEINPYNMSDDTFALSLDINSLKQTDAESASNTNKNDTDAVDGSQETATTTTTTQTTTKTLTTTGTTNTDHQQSNDEVTNLNKNISKTQYKYTTRTRNVTSSTTATNDKNTDTKISNENTQPSLIDIRSNIGLSSNSNKYVGGRRQQLNNLLNRKSQIQIQQTNETSITNTTTEPTSTNVFVGAVSSPRPFGFPRRRNRPSSFTTNTEDTKSISGNEEDAVLIKSKIYAQNSNANTNKKNQFNRSRTITSRTRTTTTLAPNAETATKDKSTEQVNELNIDEEDIESTSSESTLNSSPTPTPRRYRVLKFRRPVGGATSTNATLLNISNASNNASAINVTNTVTNNLDHPNIVSNVVEQVDNVKSNTSIENQNIETTQISTETPALENVTPTKRYRKVVRKLIRPINQTLDTVNPAVNTSSTTTQIPTTTNQRQYGTRYGFNRSIGQSRLKNGEENQEKESVNELVSVPKTEENKNNASRLQLYRNTNRGRFGNKGQPTTTTAIPDDTELEDENEDNEDEEEVKDIQTEEHSNESDQSIDIQLVSTTEAAPRGTANIISEDTDELTAEIDDEDTEDEEDKTIKEKNLQKTQTVAVTEKKAESQNLNPKVKEERVTGIVNNHLRTLLNRKTNNTVQQLLSTAKLTNSSVTSNSTDLQRLRDKLKVEQAQGERNEGVVSTKLKQLLEEKKLKPEDNNGNDDHDSTTEEEETEAKTSIELNQATVPSSRRPFIPKGRLSQTNSNNDENTDLSATKSTPTVRPTFRRKLIAKRPYTPIKPSITSISTTERSTVIKPKRKYVRRKFGRFHPFNANNRNSGEGFVRTDPRGSLLPGTNRYKSEGKQNGENSGSADEEYDEYEYVDDEDEEAEGEEIEVKSKETVANKPIAPARTNGILFNRPQNNILRKPIDNISTQTPSEEETTDNNSEIDENDEENEDESDEENPSSQEDTSAVTTNSNSPGFIPKNNRVLPGSRPPLPTGVGGNVPFNPKNRPSSQPNRFGTNTATSRFGSNTRTTNRPRVINRPPGVAVPNLTLRPIDLSYERTTLPIPTRPAPFIQTNTRTYERKYTGPSTETPENYVDNSLIEDLNIEALNARNKKIFDINSKKHTTLKPKINLPNQKSSQTDDEVEIQNSHQNIETSDESYTSFKDDQQGFITTTPRTQPQVSGNTNNNYDLNVNEISSQDNDLIDNNLAVTTPQTPATTLVHIFTLTDDEQTSSPPTASGAFVRTHLVPEKVKPKHKVVEINRIVEITSKEEKLRRKSKANQEFLEHIGSSNIKVESLPHLEQLGEISIAKFVHLVDSSDIEIDGHSTVTDYTPTEPTVSKPVRNEIPAVGLQENVQLNISPAYVPERSGKALIPEVIREAIETSTISLEGLFDNARKAKELNNILVETASQNSLLTTGNGNSEINAEKLEEELLNIEFVKPAPVYNSITIAPVTQSPALEEISTVATEQNSSENTTEKSLKATTVAAALFPTYVRPIVPLLRPESNESSPLVISIANLDKVILSKVMRNTDTENKNPEHTSKSTEATTIEVPDSNAAFSSRIASIVKAPTNVIHEVDTETKQVTGSKTHDQGLSKISGVSVDVVEDSRATKTDLSNSNESQSTSNSTVSKIVSVSTETHVVRKKKSRKHKSRHFTTTTTTTNAPVAADVNGATQKIQTEAAV